MAVGRRNQAAQSPAPRGSVRWHARFISVAVSTHSGWLVGVLLLTILVGCNGSPFLHPDREVPMVPGLDRYTVEDLWVTAADGVRLHGWDLQPRGTERGALVFFHGNAGNLGTHVGGVLWLVDAGFRVFALDYRGFGQSEGTADVAGAHRDAGAFLAAVFRREDVVADRVAVLGQSFGGAVAIHAVATFPNKERIRLLVVDSAFSSYSGIAREKAGSCLCLWPFRGLVGRRFGALDEQFSPERWVAAVAPVPVLVIHGDEDSVVPVAHGRKLHARAGEPKGFWLVEGGRHAGAFGNAALRAELLDALRQRLGRGVGLIENNVP